MAGWLDWLPAKVYESRTRNSPLAQRVLPLKTKTRPIGFRASTPDDWPWFPTLQPVIGTALDSHQFSMRACRAAITRGRQNERIPGSIAGRGFADISGEGSARRPEASLWVLSWG